MAMLRRSDHGSLPYLVCLDLDLCTSYSMSFVFRSSSSHAIGFVPRKHLRSHYCRYLPTTTPAPTSALHSFLAILHTPTHPHTIIMICRRCMQRLARRPPLSHRTFSYTPPTRASATASQQQEAQQPIHDDHQVPTSPTQSSTTPSSSSSSSPPKTKKTPAAAKNVLSSPSSVPAGTVLKGLNFLKNQQDPVALEDHEYPEWLWSALKRKGDVAGAGAGAAGDDEGDLFCMCGFLFQFSSPLTTYCLLCLIGGLLESFD